MEPVLSYSKTPLLLDLVRYRHGRTLLRGGCGWHICRIVFYTADVDSRYSRVAEEGKESYKIINRVNQKESES